MEKYIDMKSPLTGGRVKEISTTEVKEFRKEKFHVHVRYCVCEDTGEQFTTTEQDMLQFNDLYSQYRVRHGIPFPDEIKSIRQRYGLNYSQISRILGFGVNQYAKYEGGEVPSESNGKMLAAIRDRDVLLGLLKGCKDVFQPLEYDRILTSISLSAVKEDGYDALCRVVFGDNSRSLFNGYGGRSIPKLFGMVRYIVSEVGEVFPTKLNKLMFYADFHHFRTFGQSISGLRYRAFNFGPVPDHYATIYDNVPGLERRLIEVHGMVGALLTCSAGRDCEYLSESERCSIGYVIEKLGHLTVSEIIETSHREKGWQRCSITNNHISYEEAFDLIVL